jgi:DNA polymerase-1
MVSKPQLLIDADLILHKATTSAEFECDAGDDVWFLSTNLIKAKDHWHSQVEAIERNLKSDDMVFVFSGSGEQNFRKTMIDPTYKSNRKKYRKPLGFSLLREWAFEEYGAKAVSQPILEADDYIGILATTPGLNVRRIVVSEDKDFNTLPCRLYQKGELRDIDETQADHYWYTQTLTGDSADGYKGCPGIGAVKAEKLLSKGASNKWEVVRHAFIKAGLTAEDALVQARLARILRYPDWDSKTKQPLLWSPA